MGGQIQVQSQVKVGTRFSLNFPIQLYEQSEVDILKAPEPVKNYQVAYKTANANVAAVLPFVTKKKLLLVEDNPDLQKYIQLLLSDQYELCTAQNGQEALEMLSKSNEYQLILSDLMMPVMDGYQLLERLKTQDETRHIPTIILTARADLGSKLKALRIGVDDYLAKPFDERELMVRIEQLIKNQANRMGITPQLAASPESSPLVHSQRDQEWLIILEEFVQKHLDNDLLSVPFLATHLAMSKSSLLRQLKRLTGLTPNQYILEARLQKARQLLEVKRYSSISEVAQVVGYPNQRSFSRIFKKRFGKAPSGV